MTRDDFVVRHNQLDQTCAINQRYHQIIQWRCGWFDKAIRISVIVLSIVGLVLAVQDYPPYGVITAVASMIAATALNIVPISDWEKNHANIYQAWTSLRKRVERHRDKLCDDDKPISKPLSDDFCELEREIHDLNAIEPAPWRGLLIRCQEDETESRHGKGIRTNGVHPQRWVFPWSGHAGAEASDRRSDIG